MLFVIPPDFRVRYSFRSAERGGRKSGPPFQGFRCDFLYEGQDPSRDPVYYVWPEFEDSEGRPISEGKQVPSEGTALMYVIQEELRPLHKARIRPGVRASMLEGNRVVADLEVVDVLGLGSGA